MSVDSKGCQQSCTALGTLQKSGGAGHTSAAIVIGSISLQVKDCSNTGRHQTLRLGRLECMDASEERTI